ncbi:MAG: hypothetical protein L6R40_008542 [Gallowayella cf. fulva]|nr:MAG: hypothetical protein L6R40_008542 [Xanthomendoza cf. fulva]
MPPLRLIWHLITLTAVAVMTRSNRPKPKFYQELNIETSSYSAIHPAAAINNLKSRIQDLPLRTTFFQPIDQQPLEAAMKTSTISAGLAILVSVASAAPAATQNQTSQATEKLALIKFEGQIGTFWEAYPYPLTDGDETYTIREQSNPNPSVLKIYL